MAARLTHFGDRIRAQHAVASVDPLAWTSGDGRFTVHGFLVKPPQCVLGQCYPLIVDVHGGPGVLFENDFEEIHYDGGHEVPPEVYAAAGHLVLMVNPRGDPSYGGAYQEALREGWAQPTRYDIFTGVDEVIRLGYADSTRVGIAGASYGGWVTTFALSQTKRFKAGSANDPMVNADIAAAMAYRGASSTNYWMMTGFAGGLQGDVPFPNVDPRQVTTPLLLRFGLVSGERIFPSQFFVSGLPLYAHLRTHDVPVEMIVHPQEGHGIFGMAALRDYVARDLAWFDRWLKGKPSTGRASGS